MYKFLLCWRYLRTRYIALASIISVMLGVATMIVVNCIMAGFSHEMCAKMKGALSDVIFESLSLEGFPDAAWHMDEIRRIAGDDVEAMTPVVHVPAMLNYQFNGEWVTRQVNFIGVDVATNGDVNDFAKFLLHPTNRAKASFELRDGGYTRDGGEENTDDKTQRQLDRSGWPYRRQKAMYEESMRAQARAAASADGVRDPFAASGGSGNSTATADPFAIAKTGGDENLFDASRQQHTGVVLGIALASFRDRDGMDRFLTLPGDDVRVTFPTAGTPPKAISDVFTIVDFYESKMSEYDSTFIFAPIHKLQELRGMVDPTTGVANVTSIQIKLKPGVDNQVFRDKLRGHFLPSMYGVYTWQDKQGAILSAVEMERTILNFLLFLIIAVAGFGILAIFFMIVLEKTRDIGILKSLGASNTGIMGIFLSYGVSLGMVGSGVGMVMGLLLVKYINEIAGFISRSSGRPVFDPSVYYFSEIPTIIEPMTITLIVIGAMLIAIVASILPAMRAAFLHPVEALRHE